MKTLLTILFLLTAFYSNAQNNLNKITGLSSTTASVAYSLRQLSTSYTGPLVRIKVGSSFYDVYPDVSTTKFSLSSKISAAIGNYNDGVAAAGTSALSSIITSSTNATVAIWYDQSGNAVHVLNASALANIITSGTINTISGQPTINFTSTNSYLTSSTTVNYSTQTHATVNAVAQNVASIDYISGILSTGENGGWGLNYDPTTTIKGYWVDASGGNGAQSNENSTEPKIVTGTIGTPASGTSSFIYINGTQKGTKVAQSIANGTTDKIYVGVRGNASNRKFIGNISEVFMFPKTLSAGEKTALESSQSIFIGPAVTIASSASGAVCAGTSVTFTATTYNFSSTPTYQWYKNSVAINGETGASYTTSTLANADQIYVIASAVTSNSLTATITAGPTAVVTVSGDGCINKTTLSTPAGLTSYAWYKDNAPISGAISNTYSPTTAGDYKVQVTSGTCSTMSAATTIAVCGVTADGRMRSIATPTTLVSQEGGVNFGTGVSELGTTVNATGIGTTLGTIGATTAVVSGVISSTNALTTSIGVIYSTDSNFGTYSTSSTQSNVAAGTYAFTLSGLSSTTPYYAKSFIVNKAGTSYGPVVSFTTPVRPIAIGDSYGGGIVVYVLNVNDPGYDATISHGLIAAKVDLGKWAWNNGSTANTTNNYFGAGIGNTATIVAQSGTNGGTNYAAKVCDDYTVTETVGGITTTYNDWYLGSTFELQKMMQNSSYLTGLTSNFYWASNEQTANGPASSGIAVGSALYVRPDSYIDQWSRTGAGTIDVRAIRKF